VIAISKIRDQPHYRRDAFIAGLRRCGYTLREDGWPTDRRDVLVIWNRYGANEAHANQWEKRGGSVLVAENGYVGKDNEGRQLYALSVHGHNGSGWYPVGSYDRFADLNIHLKPWRKDGEHILVCGQRGIGSVTMASPVNWHDHAAAKLHKNTTCTVRIRLHPGRHEAQRSLDEDLQNAWACCVWSSSSGVKALIEGIPVMFDAPHWICADAAVRLCEFEALKMDDGLRLGALRHMAWGQWRVNELSEGEPFKHILENLEFAKWG
jgi:hypothetical protein